MRWLPTSVRRPSVVQKSYGYILKTKQLWNTIKKLASLILLPYIRILLTTADVNRADRRLTAGVVNCCKHNHRPLCWQRQMRTWGGLASFRIATFLFRISAAPFRLKTRSWPHCPTARCATSGRVRTDLIVIAKSSATLCTRDIYEICN